MNNEQIQLAMRIGEELIPDGPNVAPTSVYVRGNSIGLVDNIYIPQQSDKIYIYELVNGTVSLTEV